MRILWSICNAATIFLKISQNSKENTRARVLFWQSAGIQLDIYYKDFDAGVSQLFLETF